MKGIASIRGEKLPRIDQDYFYEVASFYPGTVITNDQDIKWKLFVQEESGRWRELRGTLKQGRRVSFKFPQQWYGKKLLVEAFLNNPEMKEPPGMIVMPVPGERSIKRISILDRNGQPFSKPPKYGQTLKVEIETVNMLGETLNVGLWERDTISATGHSATDNENIWGTDKSYKVTENNGIVTINFILDPGWAVKANRSLFEGSTHEYYLLVKGYGARTKYSHQQDVTDAVAQVQDTIPQGAAAKQPRLPQSAPQSPAGGQNTPAPTSSPQAPVPQTPAPQAPATPAPVPPSTPAPVAPAAPPVQQQATIPASGVGADPAPTAGGKSTTTVAEENVEGLTDAYFAKKEFTKKTGENAATFAYEIKSNGNKTGTAAEKKKIAGIILNKPELKALTAKKEYTTEEAIIQALTKNVYNSGDKVTFQTYKLGPEFKRIQSAPLEDKVYLVATGYLLEGKQGTITIKEKDGILKGAPDAVLPVIEITEQQMEDSNAKVDGTEKTTFTGTIANGMVKIPVQLRPKSDEELKQWKDKLAKGKEEGTYTYTFNNEAGTLISATNKSQLADIIITNAKGGLKGNPKIENGKTAYAKDVESVLEAKMYNKGEQVTFKLYKKVPELLYLRAQAQGNQQHDKEFLKKEGAYFKFAPPKLLIFPTLEKPINDPGLEWEERYWAETGKDNVVCFGAARKNGRKHAARDLYTAPSTPVVAMAAGIVIGKNKYFGANDVYVSVLHELPDGRKFIAKYCELAKDSVSLEVKNEVRQGQELGKTAHLGVSAYNRKEKKTYSLYMCHFEIYDCSAGDDNPGYVNNPPYMRRRDLIDPLPILREAYNNTFGDMGEGNDHLFTVNDGKEALRQLYNKYKDNTWSWKWEGSETEVQVTGKDVLTIVEKMYRLETTHFTSKQYQNCGTGGMEAFGSAPYYGWDATLFIEQPVGTWSEFENPGLSGAGGNAQVKDKKKEFVKLPSVIAGMEYKIKYIIKYNGNYARWFNKDNATAQTTYRSSLVGVRARFIQEIAGN